MTKRILALLLAVLLGISCFALTACGGEEETPDDGNTPTEQPDDTTTTTPPDEGSDDEGTSGEVPEPPVVDTFIPYDESAKIDTGKTYDLFGNSYTTAEASKITYASADETIATVDASGVITGVKEGETTITVTIGGTEMATFTVTVTAPWTPTDADSIAVLKAREELTKYSYMGWYNVNISNTPNYNPEGLTDTTAGPIEIWSDHLQILFMLDNNECNATVGSDNMETYAYHFMFYYRPYDETNDRGDYEVAELKAWSIGYAGGKPIYRCHFYDTMYSDMVVDTEYEVVLVIYDGETALGYVESTFTWTDSCEAFVKVAEGDSTILK